MLSRVTRCTRWSKLLTKRFSLSEVKYLPDEIIDGILYFSEEFSIAAHKCACGCGSVVYTPIKEGEWSVRKCASGPSLYPSIGNWNLPCRSHYWITNGSIEWSAKWSEERIEAGRRAEEARRLAIYGERSGWRERLLRPFEWIRDKFFS